MSKIAKKMFGEKKEKKLEQRNFRKSIKEVKRSDS